MVEHEPQRLDWSRIDTRLMRDAERFRRLPARRFQVELGFTLEKIGNPPRHMRLLAGNAQQPLAVAAGLDPDGAALSAPVHDAVIEAAQRHHIAVREGERFRQTVAAAPRSSRSASARRRAPASRLPRGGMVSTTSRVTEWMRSV